MVGPNECSFLRVSFLFECKGTTEPEEREGTLEFEGSEDSVK